MIENTSAFDWIIRNNFPEADFWLINKGSLQSLGKPVREFQPYYTGILCPALIHPNYGYYLCLYLHSIGTWNSYGHGTTNLCHLRISDMSHIFKQLSYQHRQEKQCLTLKR